MKPPLLLVVVLSLLPGCAPIPKERQVPEYYFPTCVGDTWVQQFGDEGGCTYVVRKVEDKDGAKIVTVSRLWSEGRFTDDTTDEFLVSSKGVFILSQGYARYDPPGCCLKLPHIDGGKWEMSYPKPGFERSKSRCTAFGPEEVTVPAGTFQAIRVEYEDLLKPEGSPERGTMWYAPRVGRIKVVSPDVTLVMKSFTPGKE